MLLDKVMPNLKAVEIEALVRPQEAASGGLTEMDERAIICAAEELRRRRADWSAPRI